MHLSSSALTLARERQIAAMRLTCDILGNIVSALPDQRARSLRDGADGWSITEIVCHLRDFDVIFYERALLMLAEETPTLPAFDHEALAIERAYQQEALEHAFGALKESRARFSAFFADLTPQQWECAGVHPEKGTFTMTDALMQVSAHDLDHLEQITRVLAQGSAA